jgi:DNA ligase-1
MQLFAQLFTRLDETTSTNRKIAALVDYFRQAPPADAIWAIHFLTGRRPKRLIPTRKLRQWAAELAGIPDWLFDASYDLVGDLAETITLVLPAEPTPSGLPLQQVG